MLKSREYSLPFRFFRAFPIMKSGRDAAATKTHPDHLPRILVKQYLPHRNSVLGYEQTDRMIV